MDSSLAQENAPQSCKKSKEKQPGLIVAHKFKVSSSFKINLISFLFRFG